MILQITLTAMLPILLIALLEGLLDWDYVSDWFRYLVFSAALIGTGVAITGIALLIWTVGQ